MKADVLIDITRLLGRAARGRLPTGVDRVSLAYIQQWGMQAQAVLFKDFWRGVVPYRESQQLFSLLLQPPTDFSAKANWVIAKSCLPPWASQNAQRKPVFYLSHTGFDSPVFKKWLDATRQTPVYFVHDLIPISHAEYCRDGEKDAHIQRVKGMLHTGAGLICNSQFTLDALASFADSHNLPMPPAVVAPLAPAALSSSDSADAAVRPFESPYFVMLGTIEPRKNHLQLLNVWRELVLKLGEATPHLFIIGQRGWECENVVDMLERCAQIRPFIHEVPACSDADLGRYLKHAQAMLFPSFVEGYGMPLIESLMLGTPVIASDLTVFKEVAGDVPEYLSPVDGIGWMQAVVDYSHNSSMRRQAQLLRLSKFKVPTWHEHFAAVQRLLDQLA